MFPSRFFPLIPLCECSHFFRYHYAVLAALPLMAGMAAADFLFSGYILWALTWGAAPLVFYFVAALKKALHWRALLWLLFLPLGFLLYGRALGAPDRSGLPGLDDGVEREITGVIVSVPQAGPKGWDAELRAESVDGRLTHGKIRARFASTFLPQYGDRIVITGHLRRPPGLRNPGGFDYRAYLARRGVFLLLSQRDASLVELRGRGEGPRWMQHAVIPARMWIDRTIDRFAGPEGYMLKGILVGDKQAFPDEVREDFRNTGLMHLLAVSGLNVGMVILLAYTFFSFFSVPLRVRAALCIGIVWFYAFLANLEPSMVRASIMGTAVLSGTLFRRRSLMYNSLALAAFIILIFNPLDLFDVGFALSFAATFGLLYLHPRLMHLFAFETLPRWLKPLAESFVLSLAASLATLPILAFVFNQLAPVSLVANLIAVPLSFALLSLGILILSFAWFPWLAAAYGTSAGFLTQLLNGTVEIFSRVPYGYLECATPSTPWIFFFFLCLTLAVHMKTKRWARKGILFAVVLLLCFQSWSPLFFPPPEAIVTFLDIGQGDGIVVESGNGRCVVVDAGPRDERWDAGARIVVPYLRRQGIRQLAAVVSTHPDLDHLGGLPAVIRQVPVNFILDGGSESGTDIFKEYLQAVAEKGSSHRTVKAGDRFRLSEEVYLDVCHPAADFDQASTNEQSVVLRLVTPHHSVLLTGDIESAAESKIPERIDSLQSEILKVAHHGSKTSSAEAFLDRVSPKTAVIQVGVRNRYGHPSGEVLERLRERGVEVYRTDRDGAVRVKLFEDGVKVETTIKNL